MNADEFLALVEKHPLPWRLTNYDDATTFYESVAASSAPLDLVDSDALADAAPALAAAAIRLLRELERGARLREDLGRAERDAMDALRAALPEGMRP